MIYINLTYGFGNNLFQFHFARLISEELNLPFRCTGKVSSYFSKYESELPKKYIKINDKFLNNRRKNENEIIEEINNNLNQNILLKGFFEYKNFFIKHRKNIINFHLNNDLIFSKESFVIKNNLNIIHIRLNNRLVQLNHSLRWIDPEKFFNLIFEKFPDINNWKIISDFNFFTEDIHKEINNLRREIYEGPNKFSILIDKKISLNYALKWIGAIKNNKRLICENINTSNTFIKNSGGLRKDFINDFELLMKSENLIFWSSTYSWWASFLSNKSNIYIGSPWRMDRSRKLDPSLDQANIPNKSNFNLANLRYEFHIKSNILIYIYDKIPYRIISLYSKICNFISKKIS